MHKIIDRMDQSLLFGLSRKLLLPVTNIRTMSKIVEKCVLQQMVDYFDWIGLWPPIQSAYRQHHSTETAIVYCLERVTEILARRKLALLISLDLTSAFDTVNFNVLLKILQNKLGFEGSVLRFFESYLKSRNSQVTVENELSDYFYNEAEFHRARYWDQCCSHFI